MYYSSRLPYIEECIVDGGMYIELFKCSVLDCTAARLRDRGPVDSDMF